MNSTTNQTVETLNDKTLAQYEEETKHPGKFEGESALTVFVYEESLNGGLDELAGVEDDGHYAAKIHLSGSEMDFFSVDQPDWVLIQNDQGFVFTIPAANYEAWKN